MANIKLYSLSVEANAKIQAEKWPLQAKQLYASLAEIGKPTRGVDIVAYAVKNKGLITRQDYAVLAAWYFSAKRRPVEVTLGEAMPSVPVIENTTEGLPADLEVAA